jgi:hypothetical protein
MVLLVGDFPPLEMLQDAFGVDDDGGGPDADFASEWDLWATPNGVLR